MRSFTALALASTLFAASAYAADTANQPLPAGKPAGVQNAQLRSSVVLLGLVVVAGGIALVVSQGSGNNIAASTTSSAP